MSSSYQTQYYPQQPNNNNLGLLTTGALAGGGIATLAALQYMKKGSLLQDLNQKGRDENIDAMAGKKYPKSKEPPVPVDKFTTQTTTAVGYPVGYSANPGVVQGDLAAMQQGLYKENLLLDPSKQYVVRPTGQQTKQVKRKPFRRS
tara:strand:+ start:61 stop:498 length:438 start_codon:yes stop_codon:yes gene_type:complete